VGKKKQWVFVTAFVVAKNCGSFLLLYCCEKSYCPMLEKKNIGLE
jgi:hypothetical protein